MPHFGISCSDTGALTPKTPNLIKAVREHDLILQQFVQNYQLFSADIHIFVDLAGTVTRDIVCLKFLLVSAKGLEWLLPEGCVWAEILCFGAFTYPNKRFLLIWVWKSVKIII